MAMHKTEEGELSAADYLERALDDLDQARKNAADELRSIIETAISRSREALDHLRVDTEERGEQIKERMDEWQQTLEGASDDALRELGIRAVHAQRSEDSLKAMSAEIKQQKKELTAAH